MRKFCKSGNQSCKYKGWIVCGVPFDELSMKKEAETKQSGWGEGVCLYN